MGYYHEVEELTLKLVQVPSLNNTEGERVLAEHIARLIRGWAYFQAHPDQIWEIPIDNDPLGRRNVFALVKGEKEPARQTVLLHGHVDTVGIEDFGSLADCAFNPQELAERLPHENLAPEVRNDLQSGDWMFGRGALDMKSGLAVHLAVLRKMAETPGSFSGNILFLANPVEENQHTGIINGIAFLDRLKQDCGLEYAAAINTDCTTPAFAGDKNKYLYLGSVGKLLPSFYIVGKETHVGKCFAGLDPNLIAAELLKRIDLNSSLCDQYHGEYTLPPTALKMSDLKATYNVQTPLAAFLYFNYFTYQCSAGKVVDQLKAIAREAFQSAIDHTHTQHQAYCRQTGTTFTSSFYRPEVVSYEELYREVHSGIGESLPAKLAEITGKLQTQGVDPRLISLAVVEEVGRLRSNKDPLVVIYFAPPYCPHNTLGTKKKRDCALRETIQQLAQDAAERYGESFKVEPFFPALSDSCFLSVEDDQASMKALISNFPEWHTIYPVPVSLIQKTDIPALTFGVYGKDAHCWTERVYKPYSFGILPEFMETAVRTFLACGGSRKNKDKAGELV